MLSGSLVGFGCIGVFCGYGCAAYTLLLVWAALVGLGLFLVVGFLGVGEVSECFLTLGGFGGALCFCFLVVDVGEVGFADADCNDENDGCCDDEAEGEEDVNVFHGGCSPRVGLFLLLV